MATALSEDDEWQRDPSVIVTDPPNPFYRRRIMQFVFFVWVSSLPLGGFNINNIGSSFRHRRHDADFFHRSRHRPHNIHNISNRRYSNQLIHSLHSDCVQPKVKNCLYNFTLYLFIYYICFVLCVLPPLFCTFLF